MVLNNLTKEVFPIYANRTNLSTGGIGQLYLHTTNSPESHGDKHNMAWRAGARCLIYTIFNFIQQLCTMGLNDF